MQLDPLEHVLTQRASTQFKYRKQLLCYGSVEKNER